MIILVLTRDNLAVVRHEMIIPGKDVYIPINPCDWAIIRKVM